MLTWAQGRLTFNVLSKKMDIIHILYVSTNFPFPHCISRKYRDSGVVMHICNSRIQETKVGES
jgi:hypothetical protein